MQGSILTRFRLGLRVGAERTLGVLIPLLVLLSEAAAADVHPYYFPGNGDDGAVVIEGTIQKGDFETFERIVKENNGDIRTVFCFSPGGDFYEAMKIGRAVRALNLFSYAPARDKSGNGSRCEAEDIFPTPKNPKNCTCASAGFFIHIGGTGKWGTYLKVHRPYFEQGKFGTLKETEARVAFDKLQEASREYMTEMGVPQRIQDDLLATSSTDALLLDKQTVLTHFVGYLPHLDEWLKNKCSRLTADERNRRKGYLLSAKNYSDLTEREKKDYDALGSKSDQETECTVAAVHQMRLDAYEKYFGQKPSDFGNQNFSKWSEATKYLGKKFYEIQSEESFIEETILHETHLTRERTATAPNISLFDTSANRVVSSVAVYWPNPSAEFIQRLVKSLNEAWGNNSGGNGTTGSILVNKTDFRTTGWSWKKTDFRAYLKLDTWPTRTSVHLEINGTNYGTKD
jgi:hypothetical protein